MLGLSLLFVQSHPLLPFGKSGIRPDLVLILVSYLGTRYGPGKGALVVFLLGNCFTAVSGSPAGLYPFIYLTIFLFILFLKRFFIFQDLQVLVILVVMSCFIEGLIILLFFYLLDDRSVFLISFHTIFIAQLIYTLALSPFVFFIIKFINSFETKLKSVL